MSSNDRVPVSMGMKLVALLLMVGGVVGIGVGVWLDIRWLTNSQASLFPLRLRSSECSFFYTDGPCGRDSISGKEEGGPLNSLKFCL